MRHFVGFKISKTKRNADGFSQSSQLCFTFIYKDLVKFGEKISVIPCTEEKYMSITKMFMTERR